MSKQQNNNESITSAPHYLKYILGLKKDISLPEIPELCFISYTSELITLAQKNFAHYSINIGCTNPTFVYFFFPDNGTHFAIARGQHGSPMAAVLIEELVALGFEKFLVIGAAGHPTKSATAKLQVGDLVVAEKAFIHEGTSSHYIHGMTESSSDASLLLLLCGALTTCDIPFARGAIATTDALYRETKEFVSALILQDVLAIDMEMSALYTVANYHGKAICGLLFISDLIEAEGKWQLGLLQIVMYEELQKRLFEVLKEISQHHEI